MKYKRVFLQPFPESSRNAKLPSPKVVIALGFLETNSILHVFQQLTPRRTRYKRFLSVISGKMSDIRVVGKLNSQPHIKYWLNKPKWNITRIVHTLFQPYNALFTWPKQATNEANKLDVHIELLKPDSMAPGPKCQLQLAKLKGWTAGRRGEERKGEESLGF